MEWLEVSSDKSFSTKNEENESKLYSEFDWFGLWFNIGANSMWLYILFLNVKIREDNAHGPGIPQLNLIHKLLNLELNNYYLLLWTRCISEHTSSGTGWPSMGVIPGSRSWTWDGWDPGGLAACRLRSRSLRRTAGRAGSGRSRERPAKATEAGSRWNPSEIREIKGIRE